MIILNFQVPVINFTHPGQGIQVFHPGTIGIVLNFTIISVAYAVNALPEATLGDFLDRIIKLPAGDKINCHAFLQGIFRADADVGTHQTQQQVGIGIF